MSTFALEVESVSKRYPKPKVHALKEVSLKVPSGMFFGLLGPNGAGKSTLMRILSGYLPADAGLLHINGTPILPNKPEARQQLGLVPQDLAIYDTLNPIENALAFGRLFNMPRKRILARAEMLLKAVDLWDRRKSPVKSFSGGMRRRMNLIIGLLHEPSILLCDEPTVGVDPQSRNAIFEFLEQLNRDGLTVVYTTHYMEEVERMCREIAIIDHGCIQAVGTREELLSLSNAPSELRIGAANVDFASALAPLGQLDALHTPARFLPNPGVPLSTIIQKLESIGYPTERLRLTPPSLESVFLHLTGHQLRD